MTTAERMTTFGFPYMHHFDDTDGKSNTGGTFDYQF